MHALQPAGARLLESSERLGGMVTHSLLIGIGGRLAAGKDSVADRLVDKYGFRKHWMSEALNDAMLKLNPIIGVDFDGYRIRYSRLVAEVGYTDAKNHPEVRRLLQVFGTEIGRKMLGENTWVDLTAQKIDDSRYVDHVPVVVTGIRFPNEVKMIRERGGILLFVTRPELVGTSAHASETSVDEGDFHETIVNDGSLEDLYAKVGNSLPHWSNKNILFDKYQPKKRLSSVPDVWPVYDH